jgi:hypothetical protein
MLDTRKPDKDETTNQRDVTEKPSTKTGKCDVNFKRKEMSDMILIPDLPSLNSKYYLLSKMYCSFVVNQQK